MLRFFLSALALCASVSAQLIVHPSQDLQAAVDAVPDGGWVLIHGGTYRGPIAIENKSVALVGAAPWGVFPLETRLFPSSGNQQGWSIEARGRREHVLIVHNARLGGTTQGSRWNRGGGPIRIEGYGAVWVVDTAAYGFDARDLDGREAVSGITYHATGGYLLVERCIVTGGIPSTYLGSGGGGYTPSGGAGIFAPGSTVQMLIALVQGGQGDVMRVDSPLGAPETWRPTLAPCPCAGWTGGRGGAAVVSSALLHPELAILEGGRGAEVLLWIYASVGTLVVPWGFMPAGAQWARV